jgi:PLP dependent protein
MIDIQANLARVRERIARAAERAGRRAEDVLLVGVSKTVDLDRIRRAIEGGVPALGENWVQEARGKIAELGHPVPWHLIGHLQTNKARDAVEQFDVVQSLDRLDLPAPAAASSRRWWKSTSAARPPRAA